MKPLPDIFTSAQFWASVAALWGTSGAWFTFFAVSKNTQIQNEENISNLLAGIDAELELISLWAGGEAGNVGYLSAKTKDELVKEHEDWFNPSRQIFTFEAPALAALTISPQLRRMRQLIRPLVRLNYSIRRVFDLHNELRAFVLAHPELYDSVVQKLVKKPNSYTLDEQRFMNIVFGLNLRIHQQLIGGADSQDDLCLYRAYRAAKDALIAFKSELRPEPLPRLFWLLHAAAGAVALIGMWQILRWFDIYDVLKRLY